VFTCPDPQVFADKPGEFIRAIPRTRRDELVKMIVDKNKPSLVPPSGVIALHRRNSFERAAQNGSLFFMAISANRFRPPQKSKWFVVTDSKVLRK
jgi:hypothetical protein